jgi:hypothetical protein
VKLEQRTVRQIGERIVVGEMLDPGLEARALGHVLQRGRPTAVGRALADQANLPAVRNIDEPVLNLFVIGVEKLRAIFIDIARERSELLAQHDQIAQVATRLHRIGRQPEHVEIALIADHEVAGGAEEQQALRHVVDGGVEVLALLDQEVLRGTMLSLQLPHDQPDRDDDDQDRQQRSAELQLGLLPPIGERMIGRGGCHHQDRKIGQRPHRAQPLFALAQAREAP